MTTMASLDSTFTVGHQVEPVSTSICFEELESDRSRDVSIKVSGLSANNSGLESDHSGYSIESLLSNAKASSAHRTNGAPAAATTGTSTNLDISECREMASGMLALRINPFDEGSLVGSTESDEIQFIQSCDKPSNVGENTADYTKKGTLKHPFEANNELNTYSNFAQKFKRCEASIDSGRGTLFTATMNSLGAPSSGGPAKHIQGFGITASSKMEKVVESGRMKQFQNCQDMNSYKGYSSVETAQFNHKKYEDEEFDLSMDYETHNSQQFRREQVHDKMRAPSSENSSRKTSSLTSPPDLNALPTVNAAAQNDLYPYGSIEFPQMNTHPTQGNKSIPRNLQVKNRSYSQEKCVRNNEGKALKDLISPIKTTRLRNIRQKTRNVVVNILEDGYVCLEFVKHKDNEEKVTEVLRISPDGSNIGIYQPNGGKGCGLLNKPPPIPSDNIKFYNFHDLPLKYWKRYQYAARFITLVRSKTPKVTMYTKEAKCMLMENSPNADFEVMFYNGIKLSQNSGETSIIQKDGTSLTIESNGGIHHLAANTKQIWFYAQECHQRCVDFEKLLSSLEKDRDDICYFPVIIGRKPRESASIFSEVKTSTPKTQHPNSTNAHSATPAMVRTHHCMQRRQSAALNNHQGFSQSTTTAVSSAIGQVPHGNTPSHRVTDNTTPHSHVSSGHNHLRVTPSSVRSAHSSIPRATPSLHSACSSTPRVICQVLFPHLGRGSQLSDGTVLVEFNDDTKLMIHSSPMIVHYTDDMDQTTRYKETDKLPQAVRNKLEMLPLVMTELEKAQSAQGYTR